MTKLKVWKQAMSAGLALALFAGGASAENFTIQGRQLEVPIPPGFCKLEESGPDVAFQRAIAPDVPGMQLLLTVMECNSLAELRKDSRYGGPFATGSVMLFGQGGRPTPMKNTRRDLFAGQAGLAPERHKVRNEVEAWIRSTNQPNVSDRKEIGIADVDASGLYHLSTVSVRSRSQLKPALMVQTQATTVVTGIGLMVTMTEPVGPRTTLQGILAEQKRNLGALVAANEP